MRWAEQHFPGTRIITTLAADNRDHCRTGDVLVDDNTRYRHLWESVGAVFVHYRGVEPALVELAGLFELKDHAGR